MIKYLVLKMIFCKKVQKIKADVLSFKSGFGEISYLVLLFALFSLLLITLIQAQQALNHINLQLKCIIHKK